MLPDTICDDAGNAKVLHTSLHSSTVTLAKTLEAKAKRHSMISPSASLIGISIEVEFAAAAGTYITGETVDSGALLTS